MRNNPLDWQIETLKDIAKRFGIDWRQPGTSHVTFAIITEQNFLFLPVGLLRQYTLNFYVF